MKKKAFCILSVLLACISISTFIFADAYSFHIDSMIIGYNSNPVYKNSGHSSAMVNVSEISSGVNWWNTIEDKTRATNFIVIASNGVQITNAVVIGPGYGTNYLTYYSAAHEGDVMLRGNATSTGTGYWVSGAWTPNN